MSRTPALRPILAAWTCTGDHFERCTACGLELRRGHAPGCTVGKVEKRLEKAVGKDRTQ